MDDSKYITINHLDDYMSANSLRIRMKLTKPDRTLL